MGTSANRCLRSGLILISALGLLTGTVIASQERGAGAVMGASETLVFRQGVSGYSGCSDTRISQEAANQNFGDRELVLGMKGRVGVLIRFDVSSLPANAVIEEATLGLYVSNYGDRTEPSLTGAYPVLRSWKEMEATWYKATSTDDWGLPGCNHTTTDREATSLDEASLFGRDEWVTWSVTEAVQQWADDPVSNQGLLLQQTNQLVGGEFDIRESEYVGVEVRPYLSVSYSLATPTPTSSATPSGPPTPTEPPTPTHTATPPPLPCYNTPEPGSVLVVLQQGPDYTGAVDTFLDFDSRDTSYADEWFMRVGYRRHWSGLLNYDLSVIPQGSRVVCAALSLYAERWSGKPLDVGAYYVRRENSVDEATWSWASMAVPWQEGGCNGPNDRTQTPEDAVLIHTIYRWYDWDLTHVVDGWVNGWLANNGVSLQAVDVHDTDTVWFTSSNDDMQPNRPRLVIQYVPPIPPTATRTEQPTQTPSPTQTHTGTPTVTATAPMSPTSTATSTGTATLSVSQGVFLPLVRKSEQR